MIKEIDIDIFLADTDIIVHQANCQCTMGSGIAKNIRENFPEAYAADCKTKKGDKAKLGRSSFAQVVSPNPNKRLKYIFNLYGQFNFGLDKRYTSYDALVEGFEGILNYLQGYNKLHPTTKVTNVAVPYRLGCNRAGGDWKIVRAILESVFGNDPEITLLICNNPALTGEQISNRVSK